MCELRYFLTRRVYRNAPPRAKLLLYSYTLVYFCGLTFVFRFLCFRVLKCGEPEKGGVGENLVRNKLSVEEMWITLTKFLRGFALRN
jgi:hypothetical protein